MMASDGLGAHPASTAQPHDPGQPEALQTLAPAPLRLWGNACLSLDCLRVRAARVLEATFTGCVPPRPEPDAAQSGLTRGRSFGSSPSPPTGDFSDGGRP